MTDEKKTTDNTYPDNYPVDNGPDESMPFFEASLARTMEIIEAMKAKQIPRGTVTVYAFMVLAAVNCEHYGMPMSTAFAIWLEIFEKSERHTASELSSRVTESLGAMVTKAFNLKPPVTH